MPTLGSKRRRIVIRRAKAICKGCPSGAACLQMALDADIQHGIGGGLTEARTPSAESGARTVVSR